MKPLIPGLLLLITGLSCPSILLAQNKDNPIVTYLDYQRKPLPTPVGTSFIELMWRDGDTWKAEVYDAADRLLREAFYYKQSDRKEKHGIYQAYYITGMSSDSGLYVNNKREGIFISWHENGQASGVFKYRNDMPIDTSVEFYDNGTKKAVQITDSMGNGIRKEFYGSGKTKAEGRLMEGKYSGLWHYKEEDGAEIMTVKFVGDSVVSTQCPSAPNGPCIFERPARFKGGLEGWRKFLEKNLRYPDAAIDAGITGIVKVKFVIKKDGTLEDLEVVNSPHELLSKEALRLMKKSPPWEPAFLLNKPVNYRHIQSITFALQ